MSTSGKNEKKFSFYSSIPVNIQMHIVNKMKPDDRCRFSGCSKMANIEAKSSKNYASRLTISNYSDELRIGVSHGIDSETGRSYGYSLEFRNFNGRKFIECKKNRITLWTFELTSTTNLVQYCSEFFRNLLKICQHSIKNLNIFAKCFEGDFDFGIERLDNLEQLCVESRFFPQFCSKLEKPLDALELYGDEDFAGCEKVLQVTRRVYAPCVVFNFEQLQRLGAKYADIQIGYVTENDILNFIRFWQNGQCAIDSKAELRWHLLDYNRNRHFNFDVGVLRQILGDPVDENGLYIFHHFKEPRKSLFLTVGEEEIDCAWAS